MKLFFEKTGTGDHFFSVIKAGIGAPHYPDSTLMQALLDFTLSSREALQKAVVFLIVSVTGRVLFPVRHAEAASSEAVSVLWVGGRGKIGC